MHEAYLEGHLTFTNTHVRKTVCVVQDSKFKCNEKRVVLLEKGVIRNKTSRLIFVNETMPYTPQRTLPIYLAIRLVPKLSAFSFSSQLLLLGPFCHAIRGTNISPFDDKTIERTLRAWTMNGKFGQMKWCLTVTIEDIPLEAQKDEHNKI